jgi:hypothetical protein
VPAVTLRPTLRGTGEVGAGISLFEGSVMLGSGTVGVDGAWSVTVTQDLAEGSHVIRAAATDAVGNRSALSAAVTLLVDVTPPPTPQFGVSGQVTVARPPISGTAEALSTVRVEEAGRLIGTTLTSEAGIWSLVPTDPLIRGAHTFSAVAIDQAGNRSVVAATTSILVSLSAPAAPVITSVGAFNSARPTISGRAEAGSRVALLEGSATLGSVVVPASGIWNIVPASDFVVGAHSLTATATDLSSNLTGAASDPVSILIDLTPPTAPVISPVAPTRQRRPQVTGTAEPGSSLTLSDGGTLVGRVTVLNDGSWTITPASDLAEGSHPLTAVATDLAGNASSSSALVALVIDLTPPDAPVIGPFASPTAAARPTWTGTAEVGATVRVTIGSQVIATGVAGANGAWTATAVSLADGVYGLQVTATDLAGNISPAAAASITIDTKPPAVPTVEIVSTTSPTPLLGGSYDFFDTQLLTVTVNGRTYSSAAGTVTLIAAEGRWECAVPLSDSLRAGTYSVTVEATDRAGNKSTDGTANELLIGVGTLTEVAGDTPRPVSDSVLRIRISNSNPVTRDLSQMFVDPLGRIMNYTVVDTLSTTATISGSQLRLQFASDFNLIAVAKIRVSVNPSNPNEGPIFPVNILFDADNDGIADGLEAQYGDVNGDGQNDSQQSAVASFALPNGGLMSIAIGDRSPTDPRADRNGVVVDPMGSIMDLVTKPFSSFGVQTKTWTPVSPVIQFEIANGVLRPDGSVVVVVGLPANVAPPTHVYKYGYETPTATAKTFFLFDFDGRTGGELIDTNGDGRVDAVRLVYRDGERGDNDMLVNGIIVDPIVFGGDAEVTPAPRFNAMPAATSSARYTISGSASPGATIKVYDGGTLLDMVLADASGVWSLQPFSALADGTHPLTATATLPPASVSPAAAASLVVDTARPAAPSITTATSVADIITVSGSAEPLASIKVYLANELVLTVTAGADGAWRGSFSYPISGSYNVFAEAIDAAGNTGVRSQASTVSVTMPPSSRTAVLTLSDLVQEYSGRPREVTVKTEPANLAVSIKYGSSNLAPSAVGTYAVVATVTSQGYTGTATGFLIVKPATQTISIVAPSSVGVGSASTLRATASSGLPVTLTVVSGPARIEAGLLLTTGAGEIVLRASQAGDALFAAAADVTAKINVLPELNQIYLGATLNSTARGDIALVFPTGSGAGTVLLSVPSAGLYGAYPVTLAANGTFELALSPVVSSPASDDGKVRAAASASAILRGAVRDGVLSAVIESLGLEFNAPRVSATGPSAAVAGYYRAGLLGSAQGLVHVIAGTQGKALVVVQGSDYSGGGIVSLDSNFGFSSSLATTDGSRVVAAALDATGTLSGAIRSDKGLVGDFSGLRALVPPTVKMVNMSSRAQGGTGADTLISGFVLDGSGQRTVLIRGIGPTLGQFGVPGAMVNPRIRLYHDGTLVAENDDWARGDSSDAVAAAAARVGAFSLPANSTDSALLATLPAGAYTLHVEGGTGTALAEVYDASGVVESSLSNLSIRARVSSSGDLLIGGFVIDGTGAQRVLVRAVGPGLIPFGLTGTLSDPKVVIRQGSALVAENDDWASGDAATIEAARQSVGAFALAAGSKDAALILNLAPGAYTALVTGGANESGVVLLEIYRLP